MHFLKMAQSAFGAALVVAVLASPVVAKDKDKQKDGERTVGAPGPVAGVGLVGVVVAGGVTYLLSWRRRKPNKD